MISVQKIKSIIAISKNIDDNLIQPNILVAELKYMKPLFGKLLYADIQTKYAAQTLSTIEQELVDKAQLSLAHYIIENTIPFLNYQMTEKGLQQQFGVNSQPADNQSSTNSISYLRNELRNNAEVFSDAVRDFLDENKTSFPLYYVSGNDPKLDSSYDCGVAFYKTDNNTFRGYYF